MKAVELKFLQAGPPPHAEGSGVHMDCAFETLFQLTQTSTWSPRSQISLCFDAYGNACLTQM
jgi:hypothetical protein